jgi:hypothetical protein
MRGRHASKDETRDLVLLQLETLSWLLLKIIIIHLAAYAAPDGLSEVPEGHIEGICRRYACGI